MAFRIMAQWRQTAKLRTTIPRVPYAPRACLSKLCEATRHLNVVVRLAIDYQASHSWADAENRTALDCPMGDSIPSLLKQLPFCGPDQ